MNTERSSAHDSDDCSVHCDHPTHALEGDVIDLRYLLGDAGLEDPEGEFAEPLFL